jgi:2-polyprenyl-6-methoxyphenol hydroxylase-like FAD-dependent oxidoreductase
MTDFRSKNTHSNYYACILISYVSSRAVSARYLVSLFFILLQAAQQRFGAHCFLTDHHLTGWQDIGAGVRARFTGRRTDTSLADTESDLAIAADGIHSVARQTRHPHKGAPDSIVSRQILTVMAEHDSNQRW